MQLRIFTEPQQGASYDDLLRVAQATEDLGFDAFFRSDHYLAMGDRRPARAHRRLGHAWPAWPGDLAHPARHPRHLGDLPATRARWRSASRRSMQMSGGRVELGHRRRLVRRRSTRRTRSRSRRLRALRSTRGDARDRHRPVGDPGGRAPSTSPATHFTVEGLARRCRSRSSRPHRRSSSAEWASAAPRRLPPRYAAEFNMPFRSVEDSASASSTRVRAACDDRGPRSGRLTYSNALTVCCGVDDGELRRRAEAIGRDRRRDARSDDLAGTPDQIVERIGRYAEAGSERAYLQVLDLADLDHLELIASGPPPRRDRPREVGG